MKDSEMTTNVLVAFYSTYGHIHRMALAVAEGAESVPDTTVQLRRIARLPHYPLVSTIAAWHFADVEYGRRTCPLLGGKSEMADPDNQCPPMTQRGHEKPRYRQSSATQCVGKRNVHVARNCRLAPVSSGVTTL